MDLKTILADCPTISVTGDPRTEISDVCYDSRRAGEGSLFVAVRGGVVDGHDFVGAAVENGCRAVVAETFPSDGTGGVAWAQVADARAALGQVSATFWGHPSRDLTVAGVTGTNGKTTTTFLLHHLLSEAWVRCGMLGTVQYFDGEEVLAAPRTTPESRDLQELLARARDRGCRGVAMEVSSHALAQKRVADVQFDVGVFTNLSQDHLDYHKSIDEYFAAKSILFEQMAEAGKADGRAPAAVVNIDDPYGRRLAKRFEESLRVTTFGMGTRATFRLTDLRSDFDGTSFKLEAKGRSFLVRIPLIGQFNVYNAVAALAAGNALGINLRESIQALAAAPQVPGRLESVAEFKPFRVFVDYAHTPDALENVLTTLRDLGPRRLITVFGCGGDRDRQKRPMMGAAAERISDACIVTSDNPRGEDPDKIIKDIVGGMRGKNHMEVPDRAEAIAAAVSAAGGGDIVLIAGKGHEGYQETAGDRQPFDDRKNARWAIEKWTGRWEESRGAEEKKQGNRGRERR